MMNLETMFNMQKDLGKIGLFAYDAPDRFDKLCLALRVEIGETANEHRGFKFWSIDQLPREKTLEELIDCIHFLLEIGIMLGFDNVRDWFVESNIQCMKAMNVTDQFNAVFDYVTRVMDDPNDIDCYDELFYSIFGLGEMLGFTHEQLSQAYIDKNKVNIQRQAEGY